MTKAAARDTIFADAPSLADPPQPCQPVPENAVTISADRLKWIESRFDDHMIALDSVPFLVSALMVESMEGRGDSFSYGIEILLRNAFAPMRDAHSEFCEAIRISKLRTVAQGR